MKAAQAARAIARSGDTATLKAWRASGDAGLYRPIDPLETMSDDDKVDLLKRIDAETRRMDPRIVQVMASLTGVHEVILVVTSDGMMAADVRPLVRMNVSVIVEQNGRREQGSSAAAAVVSV